MSGIVELWCCIYGSRTDQSFPVEIGSGNTFYKLKELIFAARSEYFKGLDVSDLKVWKMEVSEFQRRALV